MEKPTISVIIPVYNVEAYVETTLQSLMNQTYTHWEAIVIDDGSTDNSGSICDALAAQDSRMKVIHTENRGVASSRNQALEMATGDYIGFVDSDDILHPQFLERLYTVLQQQQADMCVCAYQSFYTKEPQYTISSTHSTDIRVWGREEALCALLKDEVMTSHLWNKLYTREVWNHIRFPEGKTLEDMAVMYTVLEACQKIVSIPEELYGYRQRHTSIMGDVSMELLQNYIQVVEERSAYIEKHYPSLATQVQYQRMNLCLRYHMMTVRNKTLYTSSLLQEQHQKLSALCEKNPSYWKAKQEPKKFRILAYICWKNRTVFYSIMRWLYAMKQRKVT